MLNTINHYKKCKPKPQATISYSSRLLLSKPHPQKCLKEKITSTDKAMKKLESLPITNGNISHATAVEKVG